MHHQSYDGIHPHTTHHEGHADSISKQTLGGYEIDSLIVDPTQHKRIDKARLPAALQDQIHDITQQRSEAEVRKSIEADFAQKLVDYKTSQSGNEYRLFGHTMVTYE